MKKKDLILLIIGIVILIILFCLSGRNAVKTCVAKGNSVTICESGLLKWKYI